MRYAVKIAYDGSHFHGSQRQGDDGPSSVEGTIASALNQVSRSTDWEVWPIMFSSRTDSGVSALGNVFTVDTELEPDELLRALNSKLENIWCWGWGRPRPEQNIRWANERWYRYHLPPGQIKADDIEVFNDALSRFTGEKDFTNFCKLENEKNPVTVIEKIEAVDLSSSGELVIVDIVGSRFLWQQVRRMVGAALDVVQGTIQMSDLELLLDTSSENGKKIHDKLTIMPPTGLVLMDVRFKDIEFNISKNALELGLRRSADNAWKASIQVLLNTAMRSMFNS